MLYTLVIAEGAFMLCNEVEKLMAIGYTVQGGVSVVHFPENSKEKPTTCFYQAMVKYEKS